MNVSPPFQSQHGQTRAFNLSFSAQGFPELSNPRMLLCCQNLSPAFIPLLLTSSHPGYLNSLHNLAKPFLKLKLSPSLSSHPTPLVAISFFGLNKLPVGQFASTGMLFQGLLPTFPASPASCSGLPSCPKPPSASP